ncbi:TonB-dependent receptor [Marinoscillum furvescens]|uniref:Iron complex outermembrane receptor protein n=1 Tax=Marinoscillum furvescens DSM 4134 TaxID=1122208 RepID=A0A3D9L976_MARFU|nr:TonB-dependent receptor [Marinoscillum furvescens]REE01612.1 iron complex outermembrane receptor protein [Marinoscillum furvescens DSM 4134]
MKFWVTALIVMMSMHVYAQHVVSGNVTDQRGNTLVGANVYLQNTGIADAADIDGNFTLQKVPADQYTLVVSFVGYSTYREQIEVDGDLDLDIALQENVIKGEEVMVYATRAGDKTPTTYTNMSSEEIEDRNLGQDLPFILKYTPSMVVNSDAGNGVGYTGIRIRGSDATRINVTVNGIPINDSESHGVFWVNMPDFSSSVNNVQVQRGVGTSTNGAAAFGATINLQTDMPAQEAFAQVDNSIGSYNTRKHTVEVNTGLINNRWAFQGRLSQIASDGYIDRAESDLKSYYLSGGYYGDKTTVKAVTFAGHEVTYQSWYGTPGAKLFGDEEDLDEVIAMGGEYSTQEQIDNLKNADRRFNYYLYDREVDDYQQSHYQLHLSHTFSQTFNVSGALHYTRGLGYFEQYKYDEDYADYGLENVTIGDSTLESSDMILRRWLDNHFYGATFSANYQSGPLALTIGGGYNYYDGDHFGEIIWSQYARDTDIRERYYDNYGRKSDFNLFAKATYDLTDRLSVFGDLQVRTIDYTTKGVDNDQRPIDTGGDFVFFNPKFGGTFELNERSELYASYAVGNREPVRNDFVDASNGQTPTHETLHNLEAGYRMQTATSSLSANIYWMDYENQLVLTGALNDVGSGIRANVPNSYRLGVELAGGVQVLEKLEVGGNLTLSRNKIDEFTEVVYDYAYEDDRYVVENTYSDTDISFSPNVIATATATWHPVNGLSFQYLAKHVGQQYLDNTGNDDRSIAAYTVHDVVIGYERSAWGLKRIGLTLMINNLYGKEYSANGYTWGYLYEGSLYQQNNYYPQATRNFLLGLSLKF